MISRMKIVNGKCLVYQKWKNKNKAISKILQKQVLWALYVCASCCHAMAVTCQSNGSEATKYMYKQQSNKVNTLLFVISLSQI